MLELRERAVDGEMWKSWKMTINKSNRGGEGRVER